MCLCGVAATRSSGVSGTWLFFGLLKKGGGTFDARKGIDNCAVRCGCFAPEAFLEQPRQLVDDVHGAAINRRSMVGVPLQTNSRRYRCHETARPGDPAWGTANAGCVCSRLTRIGQSRFRNDCIRSAFAKSVQCNQWYCAIRIFYFSQAWRATQYRGLDATRTMNLRGSSFVRYGSLDWLRVGWTIAG